MKRLHLPGFDSLRKLSPEEAAELAARVAELTKAGLPLGAGLRALAEELPGWRLPRTLHALANRLDAGDDLVGALESQGQNLPLHLRGLMMAGVRSGRLAEVLEEFVDMQRSQSELRGRMFLSLAYPFILLVLMAALAVVANVLLVRSFEKIFHDSHTSLPGLTQITIRMSSPIMWFSIVLVVLAMAIPLMLWASPKASWIWPILHRVPMLGPLLRWSHLTQFARLMALLLEQQVPLPDALRLSAAGSLDASLASGCRKVADDVEKGRVLYESMSEQRQFPSSMIPIVQWGQLAPALPDAFRSAAEMFEGRTRSQGSALDAMLLPVLCISVYTFVGAFIISLFLPMISLISCLSGSSSSGGHAGTNDSNDGIFVVVLLVLALLLALAILVIVRMSRSHSLRFPRDEVVLFFGLIGLALLAIGMLILLVAGLGPFGLVWWVILFYLVIEGRRKQRASRQYGLLWLLTIAAERSMPLAPAIEAFANEQRGSFSRKARLLAQMLNSGVPLPEALDRCPGLLPPGAMPPVRVGCETGTLASALHQATTACDLHESLWATVNGKIAYLLMLPVFGIATLVFVMMWIVPKFEKIFEDFNSQLPSMTEWLIDVSYYTFCYWYVFAPIYLIVLGVLVHVTMRYFGWIDSDLPFVGRILRRLDTAQILDTLAVVSGQKRPLSEGIASMARSYPKSDIRQRLCLAMAETESGQDWCESFQRHGLIRGSDKAILQAAGRVGNLPWAMREMADSNRRRFSYRIQAVVQAAFPPMMIFLGLLVMYMVVALFLPLIELIKSLAAYS